MSVKQILLGFLPWIAFSAISTRVGPGAVGMAALLALVLAAVFVARSVARGQIPKLLEVTAVATFAVMSAWALIASYSVSDRVRSERRCATPTASVAGAAASVASAARAASAADRPASRWSCIARTRNSSARE